MAAREEPHPMYLGGGSTPIPDPTVLTTQQLNREIVSLKLLFDTRIDAMDKAIALLQSNADKSPTIAVVDQRLTGIIKEFDVKVGNLTDQVARMAGEAKEAVSSAFNAQKEAVAKSETGFTKQIDNIGGQLGMLNKTLDDKITDLRERLNGLSGMQIGTSTGITAREDSSKAMWVIIGIIGTLVTAGIPILISFLSKGGP